jgi:sugar/nucleoside kinase (ribokinase family)
LREAAHLHVVGSSLFSPAVVNAARDAVEIVRAQGGTVSFDPNARREMLASGGMRAALEAMLRSCDLFMPSGDELTLLTRARSEDEAFDELLSLGVGAVLLKRGRYGASYVSGGGRIDVPAFSVVEVDPTGAGDCFGAAFVACRRRGMDVRGSLRVAAAAGARAVTVLGPMEGASLRAELDTFLRGRETGDGR